MNLIERLTKEADLNPDSALAHMKLGTALLRAGRTKRAEQEFNKSLEIDPECVPALVNLGGILLGRWDFAGCVEVNRRAAAAAPESLQAHYNEGLGHLYLEQAKEMVACFRRVVELDASHAGGHYYLAVGLLALDKYEEALKETAIASGLGYEPAPEFLKALQKNANKEKTIFGNRVEIEELKDSPKSRFKEE